MPKYVHGNLTTTVPDESNADSVEKLADALGLGPDEAQAVVHRLSQHHLKLEAAYEVLRGLRGSWSSIRRAWPKVEWALPPNS